MSSKKLSPEQLDEFKQTFKLFDVDGDGCITAIELKAIMKKFGYSPTQQEIEQIMKRVDTDKNGTIELQEFINCLEGMMMVENEDETTELRAAFKLFDVDGNGLISFAELKEGLIKLGQSMSEKDLNELLLAADTDGDGNISFQEFAQLMKYK